VPGVVWWYDWSNQAPSGGPGSIPFVPMIWGTGALNGPIPAGSGFLLGFNEPNFSAQSDMTPQQAAQNWPSVEALAKAQGIPIVSPGVNFCGSASDTSGCSDPNVTDPYTFLTDFFAACPGCEVDAIAVHWYNCDLPSLQGYIDGNATLAGFVQFGKPIWLTEFSCDATHSVADQQAYMQAAVPYLESNPHVYRYSWFSASPIPNALLAASDGSLTALGRTYVALPQSCQ
jgi:Glycosyl hydrolase catalytic core